MVKGLQAGTNILEISLAAPQKIGQNLESYCIQNSYALTQQGNLENYAFPISLNSTKFLNKGDT